MKYLYSLIFSSLSFLSYSQIFHGSINENYEIIVEKKKEFSLPLSRNPDKLIAQLPGFPKGFRADPNTKNFRNVTLADINEDGVQEILFAAGSRFLVYSNNELLWQKAMTGTGIYPPSVADVDNDGDLEIVQVTGGNTQKGRVYLMDHEGNNVEGFPKSYNDNWILTTAALSDLDGDKQLEIIFLERNAPAGNIHIITNTGKPWSSDWPIRLPATPAVTPTIGDIDNDGQKEIIVATVASIYAFNLQGALEEGWPVEDEDTRFSFQSPIIADLDGNNDLEIIGAAHGNHPEYYILNHDGTPYGVWPFPVPENSRSLCSPTLVNLSGQLQILMSRPVGESIKDVVYSWNEAGDLQEGFPLVSAGGVEGGVISVANIDEDAEMEYIFGSTLRDFDGLSFLHAFNQDGSEVEGFPIRPYGWTLFNGAAIGDVNGDGKMDLTALTYSLEFGARPDSIFLNVYDLNVPYSSEKVLWTTFKGNNLKDGNFGSNLISSLSNSQIQEIEMKVYPNPLVAGASLTLELNQPKNLVGQLFSYNGQLVQSLFDQPFLPGTHSIEIPKETEAGMYFIKIIDDDAKQFSQRLVIQKK